ncbi:MAG: TlpA family protein disulfide reductase [Alphaproteobacteria bacterium]|nr:TlpA family protein disulfide reductase [Alphaproteobacteria bacterium]MDE2495689.1 TlpA family protein disulfide reductase [Alphaproteobacteria bacterium]
MTLTRFRPLTIVVAAAAVVLLVVLYGIATLSVHAPPASLKPLARIHPAKAAPLPAFTGLDGKRHTLAEFRGRLVLLNLWATWCAPCVKELPALAALQKALPASRFVVVAVDVGRDKPAEAAAFLAAHNARNLGVYVDTDIAMLRAFGAYGLPSSILIDAEGREIARAEGPADWSAPDSIRYFRGLAAGS